ncbi:CD5 antigen-like [Diadema antillarum]|uniref:CD5 antigen-like n=1 Tax=Diadema antillarum TaxID=105358 RepID=UPI003A8C5767
MVLSMFRFLTLKSLTPRDNQMSTNKSSTLSFLLRNAAVAVILLLCSISYISAENEIMKPKPFEQKPQDRDVRLRGGNHSYEGRIEIYFESDKQWYTLCDTPADYEFYNLVCHTKGYGGFLREVKVSPSDLPVLKGYFSCAKDYTHLRSCTFKESGGCGNSEEVAILCSGSDLRCGPIPLSNSREVDEGSTRFDVSYPEDTRVKIVCKADRSMSGIVRCANRVWRWEDTQEPLDCPEYTDETAVCSAPTINTQTFFMHPSKLFYKYGETIQLVCRDRSRYTVLRCGSNGKLECAEDTDGCIGNAPVAPTCLSSPVPDPTEQTLVLVGGKHDAEGRVLVKKGEEWGSICADGWDTVDADVVCHQLGFGPARLPAHSPVFPAGEKKYFYTRVSCSSSDKDIHLCQMTQVAVECASKYEAEVICAREVRDCGSPPYLSPYTRVEPRKLVYQAGEQVTVSCSSVKGVNVAPAVKLTCASDGLWHGEIPPDCDELTGYVSGMTDDVRTVIGTGMLLVLIQAFIIIGPWCFSKRRNYAAAAEQGPGGAPQPAEAEPKDAQQLDQ